MPREDENYLYVKSQYKGTCATAENIGTSQRTARIDKVRMYQNLITVKNLDMSIKTFGSRI